MTRIINLFAGPGAGKSTTAAGLFYKMKQADYNVELVTEYAKDLTWEERTNLLGTDQIYIFAKQQRRIKRLIGKVDWVITDSPLLLSAIYKNDQTPDSLDLLIRETWNQYSNLSFFLKREDRRYMEFGRSQTRHEAVLIDHLVLAYLINHNIPHIGVVSDDEAVDNIFKEIQGMSK